jgi:hypothetical protein
VTPAEVEQAGDELGAGHARHGRVVGLVRGGWR